MILNVENNSKQIDIHLGRISQWCGFNICEKNKIIDLFCKYFSAYKYQEFETFISDCIKINGEYVGRKYFNVYQICDKETLINAITATKNGLINKIINNGIHRYETSMLLDEIDTILFSIFMEVNEIIDKIGNVAIEYEREKLWDIIQKSSIKTKDGKMITELRNNELLSIFINSLERIHGIENERKIIVFKNIDHMISIQEYKEFINLCERIIEKEDIHFIFLISLPDYLVVNERIVNSITIFNDIIYTLPELERVRCFVESNYPYNKNFKTSELEKILVKSLPYINYSNGIIENLDEAIVAKLISDTNMVIQEKVGYYAKAEINYFFDKL